MQRSSVRGGQRATISDAMQRSNLDDVEISSTKQTDPGTEHSSSHFPFFELPPEIRTMIYRLLLCNKGPIGLLRFKNHLSPSILRTCRQVLTESRIILYSENIFSMQIFEKADGPRAYFLKCDHFGLEGQVMWGLRLKDMKRFDISVWLQTEEDFWDTKAAVRAVCNVLSRIPQLDYLHITLDGRGFDAQSFPRVLESFTLLRNIESVLVDGVPPVYTQYLQSKLTGCSPLDHLPKMYEALEFYAGPFDCCEEALQDACGAVEEDNVDRFQRVREEIITIVTKRMANAKDNLFSHDASS
jgi:hypothetical protein